MADSEGMPVKVDLESLLPSTCKLLADLVGSDASLGSVAQALQTRATGKTAKNLGMQSVITWLTTV